MGAASGAATGAAIGSVVPGIGTAIGAGVGAVAELYGGKQSSNATTKAAQIQADAETAAAKQQADAAAAALQFQEQQAAQQRADNIAAQQANYGQWGYRQNSIRPMQASGLQANNTLAQLLGLPAQNAQLPDLPPPPNFANTSGTPSGPTGAPSSTGPNYQPLVAALNGGQSPQAVIDQFNKSQGPASTGESYAWRSIPGAPGGGVVEIPGGAYLAPGPDGQWGYTGAPSGSSSGSTAASSVSPFAPKPLGPGQPLSFVPGSLGSIAMAS